MIAVLLYIFLLFTFGLISKDSEISTHRISTFRIKNDFYALSSDTMFGRGTGQIGGEHAAEYIKQKFEEAGLKAINGSYFQNIPLLKNSPMEDSELIFNYGDWNDSLEFKKDYLLSKYSINAFIPKNTEMVFVGYGINAPEFDYNDYYNLDVSGKIVVFFSGEPKSDDISYFNGHARTVHSYPEAKFRTAIARGALAAFLIPLNNDELSDRNWSIVKRDFGFDEIMPAYSASFNISIILNPKIAVRLFQTEGYSTDELNTMIRENSLRSIGLTTKCTINLKSGSKEFKSPNVLGLIEGKHNDLKESYVIITAHYDHFGMGNPVEGDSIYNGALDNALGVSVLMEIARYFTENSIELKRSLLFIAVTGEEFGLLGSKYYLDNPKVPKYKTIANINIDGVPFIDEFNSIIGVGANYSNFRKYLQNAGQKMNIKTLEIPSEYLSFEAFNRSDQIAFANAGIPSVLVLDNTDYKNIRKDYAEKILMDYFNNVYHTPFDDLLQPVNYQAVKQYTEYLVRLIIELSETEEEPQWNIESPFLNERLRTKAEKK
jgi:Zn-dependent M28 family amino/carboxypeptidase